MKVTFALALVTAYLIACSPLAVPAGPDNGDKVAHILAFYGLSLLGAVALPKTNLLILGMAMSTFGAMIELTQGLPMVGRDCDYWDWLADTVATIAALAPMALSRWRTG